LNFITSALVFRLLIEPEGIEIKHYY